MAVTANLRYLVARVERQHAVLEVLRQRAPRLVTATDLSKRLEVSTRTVERDIAVLTGAGVPIWARRGRGGGYAIDSRASIDPVTFTPGEAAAVVASLATLGPFGTATATSAIDKLVAAMGGGAESTGHPVFDTAAAPARWRDA